MESTAQSDKQHTINLNNLKFRIHGYSYICHQVLSGEAYVCPVRTKFRTPITQQFLLQGSPFQSTSLTSPPFITFYINYLFLIRKVSPRKRQGISLSFFPNQGSARIPKFIITSVRIACSLLKKKLKWK